MGMSPSALLGSSLRAVADSQTVGLALVVAMIMVMSTIMEQSGHMARLVRSFSRLSRDYRTIASVMSALIGLLPMPGGALFSAPMVESSLSLSSSTSEQKTALNYWFRHIWEYWWPLYPGVILAIALLEVETWQFMVVMAPMSVLSIGAGTIFILRPIGGANIIDKKAFSLSGTGRFLWEMMPIVIVISFMIILTGLIKLFSSIGINLNIPSFFSILPGLLLSIIWVCIVNHSPLSQLTSAILNRKNLIMTFLILTIMIFKGVMDDSSAVVHIRNELMSYQIPVILVIIIMPFISGFILGIAIGFVGASFPLIIPLFNSPDLVEYLSYGALAYSFGYMGMMLSPVHLCLLVTKNYFHAGLLKSYRYIIKPALLVMTGAVLLFLILRSL